jgi:regulator of sigma E protease
MELIHSILSNVWSAALVVFFFGSSIFVHELGHFLAARRRGVVVERFSIGMGPAMLKWRAKDGVEYWLSWLPIGGYVRLPQLADMGAIEGDSTVDVTKLPPPSYTTRVLVFVAGAIFNLVFAFFLACILWVIGLPTREDASTTQIGYVMQKMELPDRSTQLSPAAKAGLRPGDTILEVDGTEVSDWSAVQQALALGTGRTADGKDRLVTLKIRRGEQVLDFTLNPVLAGDQKMRKIGVSSAHRIIVGKVVPGSVAESAGLRAGDRIVRADDLAIMSAAQLADYMDSHAAGTVKLGVQRGPAVETVSVGPQKQVQDFFNGFEISFGLQLTRENPFKQFQTILMNTLQSIASLVNPHSDVGLSKMSGPVGIISLFWDAANSEYPVRVAMWLTVLINISLAVFNLLPIPVLDGGHILFATIGKLRGRALPPDFVNAAQSVFIVLLFSMVIYLSVFDVRRIVRSDRAEPTPAAQEPKSVPAPAK